MTVEMIEVGETTGSLETMLLEVAEFHEGELDLQLSRLTTWIEPLLLVLMGILVGVSSLSCIYLFSNWPEPPKPHVEGTIPL